MHVLPETRVGQAGGKDGEELLTTDNFKAQLHHRMACRLQRIQTICGCRTPLSVPLKP